MIEVEQAGEQFFDAATATREELIRKTGELTRVIEGLEMFTCNVAHDLFEPLRAIRVYSQMLQKFEHLVKGSEAGKHLAFICSGAAEAQILIEDLLLYARMKRVGLQSPQPINLNQLLSSVISAMNPRLQESEATVRFSSLPMVWGQELELKRLFINLLTNALKYRREGIPGHVELVAEARGDEFVIAIKDNGIGFDTLDALEIFKPFKRLKQDFASGTGLGLAIAKAIVERHGGRIWATSDGVTGATFFFTLQRADQEERSVKAHA